MLFVLFVVLSEFFLKEGGNTKARRRATRAHQPLCGPRVCCDGKIDRPASDVRRPWKPRAVIRATARIVLSAMSETM